MSNGKSPDEIEREIEATRHELRETVDALERKLSPGQMLDDMLARFRGNGNGELLRVVRENPVPVVLIGIGIGWLFLSQMRRERYLAYPVPQPAPPAAYPPSEALPAEEWPEAEPGSHATGRNTAAAPPFPAPPRGY